MNPDLERLHSYPFQKLRALLDGAQPRPGRELVSLHIGEPKHPTPAFIKQALIEQLDGLASYPQTLGSDALRTAIAEWLKRRHGLKAVDPRSEVIPVNGSREALFAFAQAVIDSSLADPVVVCPNPFYQLYEGAALQAAQQLGRHGYPRLVMFSSLSKRSNVPGMRSGFVAGDAAVIKKFLLYRTYQGCAMSPAVQAASAAAWKDEAHVAENRRLYREKFAAALEILRPVLEVEMPEAAFYLWPKTPLPDPEFALRLYREQAVSLLPGSYLAREARGVNPGTNRVRVALVASRAETVEAAQRIRAFVESACRAGS